MHFLLTKNTNASHVIRYVRDDATSAWMHASDYFIRHDLSHYALETILGYKTAFNGLLNGGMDPADFNDREKRLAMKLTAEAWYAENMANLFLMELAQGEFPDFNEVQQATFRSFNLEDPLITLEVAQIDAIRKFLRKLLQQWDALAEGETMTLIFEA